MEIWKQIPNSKYEASSLGRIRNPWGRVLTPCKHGLGYHIVGVRFDTDEKVKTRTVHSLVCLAFHGPRPDGLDIAHSNCVKTDNRPENLRYATRSENLQDSIAMGVKFGGSETNYPWAMIDVGATFITNPVKRVSIYAMCWKASRLHGRKFSAAANDDGSWTVRRVA